MRGRLDVLIDEREQVAIREIAASQPLTVSEWVRRVLRAALAERRHKSARTKHEAIAAAAAHQFPAGDIESLLAEIESGYLGRPAEESGSA